MDTILSPDDIFRLLNQTHLEVLELIQSVKLFTDETSTEKTQSRVCQVIKHWSQSHQKNPVTGVVSSNQTNTGPSTRFIIIAV